ncbi:MAG: PD-(D/E)XK nuclease family protein [Phaeodactylibacter sp.]|nr:PD-(D/E)XK nuclease family protein [Phaeodactylibacter sp.]
MESTIADFSKALESQKNNFQSLNKSIVDDWNSFLKTQKTTSIGEIENVISVCTNSTQPRINYFDNTFFQEITNWYKAVLIDKKKHFREGHNFNVFHLFKEKFGFYIQETMHSRLLKFLLDAKETHGQGGLFLLKFLEILGIQSPETGTWQVTAEVGRIDVLIERKEPQSIIVIENKSNWAPDQSNQLYRYWHQAIFQKTKQADKRFYENNTHKYQILYLTPYGNKKIEHQSISKPKEDPESIYQGLPEIVPMEIKSVTFDKHIQDWLNACLEELPENNHRIREYILQYQLLCNNL